MSHKDKFIALLQEFGKHEVSYKDHYIEDQVYAVRTEADGSFVVTLVGVDFKFDQNGQFESHATYE
ncbi:MAG: hypothetical protein K2Y22_06350 [Candidatus Obscuribacterales bacterium]|nr:hypothetical protein [Candidatus Obscuribacterales bacterium]